MAEPEALWRSLEAGGVLLTGRARLARRFQALNQRRQRAAGKSSWAAPAIFALPVWLERCWVAIGERLLLSAAQEALVWEQIATGAGAEDGAQARAAAVRAAEAWQLTHAWRLEWKHTDWQERADSAAFAGWAGNLRARAERNGWITAAELAGEVAAAVGAGKLRPPPEIWLAGFEPEEPQVGALIAACERAGSTLRRLEPERAPAAVELQPCNDSAEEWERAAAWARECMEAEPGSVTGVIVPDLAQHRAQVEAIFAATLQPSRAPWSDAPAAWHLSLGAPLAEQPLVAAALAWLEALPWVGGGANAASPPGPPGRADVILPLDQIGGLLRSRFCAGGEQEAGARAAFEATLRRQQWIGLRLERLGAGGRSPQFAQALTAARTASAAAPQYQGFARWAATFARTLTAGGWPGERALSSSEFQAQRAWQALLDTLASLDEAAPAPAPAEEALDRLRRLAGARIFQPQESGPAPVQVLGWLEAVGEEFDHLWVTGLHDGVLPAPAAPHPLLPLRLQRECHLPHASAAEEGAFAERLWERLRRSSGRMVASYPEYEGDAELRPSPLLGARAARDTAARAPFSERPPAATPARQRAGGSDAGGAAAGIRLAATRASSAQGASKLPGQESASQAGHLEWVALERVQDATAPPLVPEARQGGSSIFSEQVACPFRAFAHLRLRAAGLEAAPVGLAVTRRGVLLHRVLAGVWQELRTQAALLAASDAELSDLTRRQATAAVDAEPLLADWPGLQALEQARLERTVVSWLKYEKKLNRRPFAVGLLEEKLPAEFGGLRLQLQRDRVDLLESGGRVLVDYKSGSTSRGDWNPARFLAPQLPLYLVTDPQPEAVAAIAFAQVKPGRLSLKAVAAVKDIVPRAFVPPDWEERTAEWLAKLEQLAADYLQGAAGVTPLAASCCRQCDLPLLCRIGTIADSDDAEDGSQDASEGESGDGE